MRVILAVIICLFYINKSNAQVDELDVKVANNGFSVEVSGVSVGLFTNCLFLVNIRDPIWARAFEGK